MRSSNHSRIPPASGLLRHRRYAKSPRRDRWFRAGCIRRSPQFECRPRPTCCPPQKRAVSMPPPGVGMVGECKRMPGEGKTERGVPPSPEGRFSKPCSKRPAETAGSNSRPSRPRPRNRASVGRGHSRLIHDSSALYNQAVSGSGGPGARGGGRTKDGDEGEKDG